MGPRKCNDIFSQLYQLHYTTFEGESHLSHINPFSKRITTN